MKKYIYYITNCGHGGCSGEVVLTEEEAAIAAKVMNNSWLNEVRGFMSPSCFIDTLPRREATEEEILEWERMCR